MQTMCVCMCVCVCVCVSCAQIATGSSPVHAYHFTMHIACVSVRERGKEQSRNV